jgi:hypothetical protein
MSAVPSRVVNQAVTSGAQITAVECRRQENWRTAERIFMKFNFREFYKNLLTLRFWLKSDNSKTETGTLRFYLRKWLSAESRTGNPQIDMQPRGKSLPLAKVKVQILANAP